MRAIFAAVVLASLAGSVNAQSCADFTLMRRIGQDGEYRQLASRYFRALDQQAVQRGERSTGLTGNSIIGLTKQNYARACTPGNPLRRIAKCEPYPIMDDVAVGCQMLVAHTFDAAVRYMWMSVQQGTYVIVRR
jgi:hypothetical protein